MSTSAIGTTLDAIRAGLVLRDGLAGVNVFSGPVAYEEAGLECIAMGDAVLTEVAFAMGGAREETWTVHAETYVLKPWAGDTELTIASARDRALALWAEVESYLNDTYTGSLPDASMESGEMEQGFGPDGRWCRLRFDFRVTAVKNP